MKYKEDSPFHDLLVRNVPADLHTKFKIKCLTEHRGMSEICVTMIQAWVDEGPDIRVKDNRLKTAR